MRAEAELTARTGRPLCVGIDARPVNRPHVRGMGRYITEVVRGVSQLTAVHWHAYCDRPDWPIHEPEAPAFDVCAFDIPGCRWNSWMQLGLPWHARRDGVDVLHATATTMPWWQPRPTVVTIHDTVPWDGDGEARRGFLNDRLLPAAYRRCAAVITISENSRRDIVRLWPELECKLHVIPHGVGDAFLEEGESGELSQEAGCGPYFVYLGGELPRKRLDWALRVMERLGDDRVRLVICGVDESARERVLETAPVGLRPRMKVASYLEDAEMARLLRGAVGLLYPTLYEGFGFPAVEAQAVGTPVLMSPVGSLVELEGPGAFMLPPEDLDAWVGVCRQLLAERGERPAPREDARIWARRFSWEESSRRHLELYRSVAGRSSENGDGSASSRDQYVG